jgi:hypothetical protein
MLSNYGGPALDLQQEPSDEALITDDTTALALPTTNPSDPADPTRRAVLTIPSPNMHHSSEGYIQKPALEQIGRKELTYMSQLQRDKKYRYKEVLRDELEGEATPLDVRGLIAEVIRMQRQAARSRGGADTSTPDAAPDHTRRNSRDATEARAGPTREPNAATGATGRRRSELTFSDDLPDELDDVSDEDQFADEDGYLDNVDGAGAVREPRTGSKHHSSRDQNVGNGITYAEYLLWKSKRKQQQREEQQLDALKNSLNIQLRGARRHPSVDANTSANGGEDSTAQDAVLTEAEFQQLMQIGAAAAQQLDQAERSQQRDYTRTNSEVDFILSRCSSRAEAVKQGRKFSNNKRGSVGGALHFGTAALQGADSGEESRRGGSTAVAEASRRARGESVRSARASLSLRASASLLQKLGQLVGTVEPRKVSVGGEVPLTGQLASRQSVRHSIVDRLGTIPERGTLRASLVGRKSMYGKSGADAELPLEEARVIAHTIVHGVPPPVKKQAGADGADTGTTASPTAAAKAAKAHSSRYDMQILQYIANDELILSGWEKVDLLAMNENETFSGHTFRFDDTDDRARVAVLKSYTDQVALSAEQSASAVESEFRAAIVNLNRLVGKKITDAEVRTAPAEESTAKTQETGSGGVGLAAAAETVGHTGPMIPALATTGPDSVVPSAPAKAPIVRADRHRHHHAILAGAGGMERANSYDRHSSTILDVTTTADGTHSSTTTLLPHAAEEQALATAAISGEAQFAADLPRRPSEPKPSASFSSPRKKLAMDFQTPQDL